MRITRGGLSPLNIDLGVVQEIGSHLGRKTPKDRPVVVFVRHVILYYLHRDHGTTLNLTLPLTVLETSPLRTRIAA